VSTLTITVHEIAIDGLPPNDDEPGYQDMIGRIAFLFDGCIVTGWPLHREEFPQFYTPEAVWRASGLADSIGVPQAEQDRILDQCGRTFTLWEADSDVGHHRRFCGVTHWLEFPVPVWDIERGHTA
jgi:hypothetical protein